MPARSSEQHEARRRRRWQREWLGQLGIKKGAGRLNNRASRRANVRGSEPSRVSGGGQGLTTYNLVLVAGPPIGLAVSWRRELWDFCSKTIDEAVSILSRAKEGQEPVLASASSKEELAGLRNRFSLPLWQATMIREA